MFSVDGLGFDVLRFQWELGFELGVVGLQGGPLAVSEAAGGKHREAWSVLYGERASERESESEIKRKRERDTEREREDRVEPLERLDNFCRWTRARHQYCENTSEIDFHRDFAHIYV